MAASMEVGGWRAELEGLLARFGRLFVRAEPRQQAGRYLEGLLAPVERKNGWQLAEHLGDARPWRTQRVLSHVLWDEEAARDLCREHAVDRLGDDRPGAGRRRAVRLGAGRRGVRRRPAAAGDAGGARPALRPGDPRQRQAGRGARRRGRAGHAGGADARLAAAGVAAAERRRGHQGCAPLRLGAGPAGPAAGAAVPGALVPGPALDRGPRGPGLLRRVRPGGVAAARPGPGGGAALAGGGVLRGRQAGGGPGGLRGQELARLAPARDARHAGARPARRAAGRPEQDKGGARAARQLLVPLSVPEVRRLITRLALGRGPPPPAFVLAWSFWRRGHQAVARAYHWGRQLTPVQPQL